MSTFKPIAINKEGVVLPYKEGQYIVATKPFTDGVITYQAGVYVDMLDARQQLTMQGPQGEQGVEGLSIYLARAQTTLTTTSIPIMYIELPPDRTVKRGDFIIANSTHTYLYLVRSVDSGLARVSYRGSLRGAVGETGATPNISMTATVDNSEGTPSVAVSKSGTEETPEFLFEFQKIKGATGAGFFHTMAASSTSIAISSLQPQLTPFVGDAVMFPNGDVRQITAVSGSTVTLGDVLFSYKGAPGIGGATLSDIDGESNVDGFTQSAVKGIAQAKNYYNLSAFDTYVPNGDGTGNVQRTTIFLSPQDLANLSWTAENNYYRANLPMPSVGNSAVSNIWNQGPYAQYNSTDEAYANYFNVENTGQIRINKQFGNNSISQLRANIIEQNVCVQYKTTLTYIERVIDKLPIRPANQQEEWDWHEEWGKGLNLCNITARGTLPPNLNIKMQGNTFSAIGSSANGYARLVVADNDAVKRLLKDKTTYTLSQSVKFLQASDEQYITFRLERSDGVYYSPAIADITFTIDFSNYTYNFTIITGSWVGEFNETISIMLVQGSHAYPPKPYYGGIVRQKELPLFITATDENPAQIIGGDWEDKGTVTTSDGTVLHVYRRL